MEPFAGKRDITGSDPKDAALLPLPRRTIRRRCGRISSNDLSKRMNVTASQIRQDLNNFGGFGQQGYGYNVKYLYEEIGKILGLNRDTILL